MDPKEALQNLKFAKYKIPIFELIIPGYDEPYRLAESWIGNFTIEKDYENYVYPYMEFRVMVPDNVYADILENSENVYVHIRLEYGYFDSMYESESDAIGGTFAAIFDDRFYAFIDNNSPKLSDGTVAGQEKLREDKEGDTTQYSYENQRPLVLAVYVPDHVFNCNQIVNAVLSKATTADAVAFFAKKLGLKKILMSPSDNPKIHEQLIIPPKPGAQGLLGVVNDYALHKHGTIVFFDYDRIYVIDKKLGSTAWVNNEYKRVYLGSFPGIGEASIMRSGYYANDQEKYIYINLIGNNVSIENNSLFDDQIIGGNIIAIDANTGEITKYMSKLKVADASMSKQDKFDRVIVQNVGTATPSRAKSDLEQGQKTLTVLMQDVNLQALSPNREFIFTTDNTKYADALGTYRITQANAVFTKESTLFTGFFTATFVGGLAT